jgi:hypothetical protein
LRHDLNLFFAFPGHSDPDFACRPGGPRGFAALQHERFLRLALDALQAFFCTAQKYLMPGNWPGAKGFRVEPEKLSLTT